MEYQDSPQVPAIENISCRYCKSDLPKDAKYCPQCGKPQFQNKKPGRRIVVFSSLVLASLLIVSAFGYLGYRYGAGIRYQLNQRLNHGPDEFDRFFAQWDVYGIDVSEYQGSISWKDVDKIFGEHQIYFTFIRATAGKDYKDKTFERNWQEAADRGFIRGAYHYYRPNENSVKQAENFISNVKLKEGDLPPVLDIERLPSVQSVSNLKKGLRKWLLMVEDHYGVKPIVYSSSAYFSTYLKNEFKDYPVWIANYNRTRKPVAHEWKIWQYSDRGRAKGISGHVDINVFDGSAEELKNLCLK